MSATDIEELSASDNIPIIQITENGIEGFEILCRLCANKSDNLIPIYSEEGVSNDLSTKMNLYLPVKVTESDSLPLQCCFQCASTVLNWHELVIASVEADKRLRDLHNEAQKHLQEQNVNFIPEIEDRTDVKEDSDDDRQPQVIIQITENDEEPAVKMDVQHDQENFLIPMGIQKLPCITRKTKRKTKHKPKKDILTNTSGDSIWIKTEELDQDQDEDKSDLDNSDEDDFKPEFLEEEQVKKFDCKKCGMDFSTVRELRMHKKECIINRVKDELNLDDLENNLNDFQLTFSEKKPARKVQREFHCEFCFEVYSKFEDLRGHISEHHPEKLSLFEDKKNLKRRKINQELINQAKMVVEKKTYYHCNDCGKNLHSPYTFLKHIRIHTGERPHVCDLCGKRFRVSQGLVRHLRETHAGIKNYPCDICGRMFSTRRNVEEHRRIHTNERPYVCDLCGKTFKQKASLFVHNRSHNDVFPFRCTYCNQGFRTKPPLLIHMTRHTGEKPYSCDICGRSFRIKYEVKRHKLIHSDEKPFTCQDCGLSFRQKRYLRNHNRINHNRETPDD